VFAELADPDRGWDAIVIGEHERGPAARNGGTVVADQWPGDVSPDEDVSVRFDTGVAHPARVYDYWLGGKDNFAADREAAEQVIAVRPTIRADVRANRAFLGRAVRYLTGEAGIRQFLDIGTGLPSADNTHEVAQSIAPESRVVYTDNDRCKSGCVHARAGPFRMPEANTGSGSAQSVPQRSAVFSGL
jgi:S-adenosyl methyltransferase